MNRTIYWSQEQLRSYDLLWFEKDVLAALGGLEIDVAGANTTVAGGLAATQTTIASLTINVAAGRIYQQAQMDSSSFGALGADTTIVQQAGFAAAQQVALSTSGISAGQSRWSLVQGQFAQDDSVRSGDPTGGVLYYYNSSNPSSPFQGPANSSTPNNTVRSGVLVLQVVSGSAATTGSEVPPNPTNGWIPLYLIDLSFGQTAIINSQILLAGPSVGINVPNNYPGAPILAGLLNSHHSGLAGNAPKINLTSEVQGILPLANLPASSAPVGGGLSTVQTYAGNPNGHVAGNAAVVATSAPDQVWDSTDAQWWTCVTTGNAASAVWVSGSSLSSIATAIQNETWVGFTDSGAADALVITPSPATTAYVKFQRWSVQKSAAANATTTPTLNVSSQGAKTIVKHDGTALSVGDLVASGFYDFEYDGTSFRCVGFVASDVNISLAALHALTNMQTFVNSTRTTITGLGASVYVTAISGTMTKKSGTSNLAFWITAPTFYVGTGPVTMRLKIGAAQINGIAAPSTTSLTFGQAALNGLLTGLSAGTLTWEIDYARADGTSWSLTSNPNATDDAWFAAQTQTAFLIGEIEP